MPKIKKKENKYLIVVTEIPYIKRPILMMSLKFLEIVYCPRHFKLLD